MLSEEIAKLDHITNFTLDIVFAKFQLKREKERRSLHQIIHVCALRKESEKGSLEGGYNTKVSRMLYLP